MVEWPTVRLGDVLNFVGSGITPRGGEKVYTRNGVKFIRSQNVYPDELRLDSVRHVPALMDEQMKRTRVHPRDVLLNISGASIGRSATVPDSFGKANVNQHVCILRTNQFEPRFLCFWLNSPAGQQSIMGSQKGATRQGLNYGQIRAFEVPLPPLDEQKRIVARLDSMLGKIKQARELIQEARDSFADRRAAILAKAFRGELTAQWREENPDVEPAEELLERIREEREKAEAASGKKRKAAVSDEPIEEPYPLPTGWKWVRLGELMRNLDGQRVPISRELRAKRHGQYPYYGASGQIDTIDDYTHDGDYLLLSEDGANLLARSTPIAFRVTGKVWVNNHAHVLDCSEKGVLGFVESYMNGTRIDGFITGTAQPKLTQRNMDNLPIACPPLNEMEAISRILEGIHQSELAEGRLLEEISSDFSGLEQSILARAFRGELS